MKEQIEWNVQTKEQIRSSKEETSSRRNTVEFRKNRNNGGDGEKGEG